MEFFFCAAIAPLRLFPRKAENRPYGWNFSFTQLLPHCVCSPGRPKNGLADGILLLRLRRRAAATWERRSAPAARGINGTAYTKACTSYFRGASAPHRIHWTAGKLPFRLQSKHGVRSGADAECSLPAGHAQRSRSCEHGERRAEVCGHACL